ncbi:DNA polymerase epsilon subunit B [Fomitopsis serialis]|uniref:DNA polymerase epsilon subunit B n=1 Tax=Fomitopsis serialis TaxID=139415 RepID=UPI0020079DF1|nr:DNA polymerase epsilon subunit B [Neoantrodia serialis]KAH9938205.1 DNA polymerase epsilon subunit B [Neoantrodia serialis]
MADPRQRVIIKVFRKYSHSLGPESLEFLEEILERHEIPDEDAEFSIEWIAKEYNKQDDAQMKVSLDVLQRAEAVDPDSHLHFIDAFDMPLWHWSHERSTFERAGGPLTISGSADSQIMAMRNRLNVIRQTVLRNDHFSPSTLPSRDRERLLTLRSTKQLLGRSKERFLLFGMLSHNKEGKLCLEDQDGSVELDFSLLDQPSEGLFTEGCFALVEGDYTEDATLSVIAVGHPPCESRESARSIYGHIDFLGKGATTLLEESTQLAARVRLDIPDLHHPDTLRGLRKMFDHCMENSFIPRVMVLCGNFSRRGLLQADSREARQFQDHLDSLADLIAAYPLITRTTHFVFVPGPLDIAVNSALPRWPLMSSFVARLKSRIPKVHFGTNPCRIKFFEQEIVIFRENLMARMLRNLVGVKPNVHTDDLKRYLVQSVLDQSHLVPLTTSIQPILSDFDHALRLYPLPTAVVLADKYDRYQMTYEGCHVFNPGSFVGNSFTFSAYTPSRRESEEW